MVPQLYIIEKKLKHSRRALKQEKIDLVTIDIVKKTIDGSKVLDESDCDCDCDDDVDEDDIEDGNNNDNVLDEIGEYENDDDIEEDSNENQEEDKSVQEENNCRNLLQTTRYGRTYETWRGRARAADFP